MEHTAQRDDSCFGWDGEGGMRFHHATWSSVQFKTYELLFLESSIEYFGTVSK